MCIIEGCDKVEHTSAGYCSNHYYRVRKYGCATMGRANKYKPNTQPSVCSVSGCSSATNSKGLCAKHDRRLRVYGDVNIAGRTPPNTLSSWIISMSSHNGGDCLKWPFGGKSNGYGVVTYDGKGMNASRAMCIEAHGYPRDQSLEAAHSCGNGHNGCVNPNHLSWKSPKDNTADKIAHGTVVMGEDMWSSKLRVGDIQEIFNHSKRGISHREIGELYGVSRATISDVISRRTWKQVPVNYGGG